MRRTSFRLVLAIGGALLASQVALAADPAPPAPADPTPAQRKQMAAAHRTMAECLESDRPFAECHAAMQQSCRDAMGAQGCPMMMGGGGMMGRGPMGGMRHGPGMMGGAQPAPTPTPEAPAK